MWTFRIFFLPIDLLISKQFANTQLRFYSQKLGEKKTIPPSSVRKRTNLNYCRLEPIFSVAQTRYAAEIFNASAVVLDFGFKTWIVFFRVLFNFWTTLMTIYLWFFFLLPETKMWTVEQYQTIDHRCKWYQVTVKSKSQTWNHCYIVPILIIQIKCRSSFVKKASVILHSREHSLETALQRKTYRYFFFMQQQNKCDLVHANAIGVEASILLYKIFIIAFFQSWFRCCFHKSSWN